MNETDKLLNEIEELENDIDDIASQIDIADAKGDVDKVWRAKACSARRYRERDLKRARDDLAAIRKEENLAHNKLLSDAADKRRANDQKAHTKSQFVFYAEKLLPPEKFAEIMNWALKP